MKKFLKILLGFIVVILLIIGAAFYFTAGIAKVGEDFFDSVADNDISGAYEMLAQDFKDGTSQQQLLEYLQSNSMDQVDSVSWDSRNVNMGRGEMQGTLTTKAGSSIPISVSLVKEDKQWKIYSLLRKQSGIQGSADSVVMPSEPEQISLVSESMAVFAKSVSEGSMATFHSHISNLWRKQHDVEKLDDAFASFYSIQANFSFLQSVSPIFSEPPSLDENKVMKITGYYPLAKETVYFEQKYIKEGLSWKLLGFNIRSAANQ
jgi:hypothetical protein